MQLSVVVFFFFFLADIPQSTEEEVEQRSLVTRATADPVWCFVQLYISWMLPAKMLKYSWAFQVISGSLSRGANRDLTPARTCEDRRKIVFPAVAGREMLGVPYINRP